MYSNRRMSEGGNNLSSNSLYMNKTQEQSDMLYMNNVTDKVTYEQTDKLDDKQTDTQTSKQNTGSSFCLEPLGFSLHSTSKTSLFDDQSPGFDCPAEEGASERRPGGSYPTEGGMIEGYSTGAVSERGALEDGVFALESPESGSDPLYDMVANIFRPYIDEQTDNELTMPGDGVSVIVF